MTEAVHAALAALMIGLALFAVLARDAMAAVVGFVAYGLLLTIAWVLLRGVDVALTEGAIGGGLTGALLILAAARLRPTEAAARLARPAAPMRAIAALLAAATTLALSAAVLLLPVPAPTLAPQAVAAMGPVGVGNPITAVLLAYRALDTLLEAVVLVFALVGVWSLAPDAAWGARAGTLHRADPHGVLAYLARTLPPVGLIVGLYVFWVGADAPGGKFQGATIVAAMWLLAVMAGLADLPRTSRRWQRAAIVAGPLAFIAIGMVGAGTAGAFLAYPEGFAKPLIVAIELALMPTLTLVLALLTMGAPREGRA